MFILLLLKPKRKQNAPNRPNTGGVDPGNLESLGPNVMNGDLEPSDGTPFSIGRDVNE